MRSMVEGAGRPRPCLLSAGAGRPHHRPSDGPPPPPLRGMGGWRLSSHAKRGRGTMRSMVEGAMGGGGARALACSCPAP